MSQLEFAKILEAILRYLPWPLFLFFVVRLLKDPISTLLVRLLTIKYKGVEVQFAKISRELLAGKISDSDKAQLKLKQIVQEGPHYTLYSNGLLVEKMTVLLLPGESDKFLVFPIAFPNEVISIQIIGDIDWQLEKITPGNCRIKFAPVTTAREIDLKIVGL